MLVLVLPDKYLLLMYPDLAVDDFAACVNELFTRSEGFLLVR